MSCKQHSVPTVKISTCFILFNILYFILPPEICAQSLRSSANRSGIPDLDLINIDSTGICGLGGNSDPASVIRFYKTGSALLSNFDGLDSLISDSTDGSWAWKCNADTACNSGIACLDTGTYAITQQVDGFDESLPAYICFGTNTNSISPTLDDNSIDVNDNLISGTSAANAVISITFNSDSITHLNADNDGNWSISNVDLEVCDTLSIKSIEEVFCPSDAIELIVSSSYAPPIVNCAFLIDSTDQISGSAEGIEGDSVFVYIIHEDSIYTINTLLEANSTWSISLDSNLYAGDSIYSRFKGTCGSFSAYSDTCLVIPQLVAPVVICDSNYQSGDTLIYGTHQDDTVVITLFVNGDSTNSVTTSTERWLIEIENLELEEGDTLHTVAYKPGYISSLASNECIVTCKPPLNDLLIEFEEVICINDSIVLSIQQSELNARYSLFDIKNMSTNGTSVNGNGGTIELKEKPDTSSLEYLIYVELINSEGACNIYLEDTVRIDFHPIPAAENDAYEFVQDTIVDLTILTNDNYIGSDTVLLAIIQDVAHGSLEITDSNTLHYNSPDDYFGNDTAQYVLCQGCDICDTAYIYLTITKRPNVVPVIDLDEENNTTSGNNYIGSYIEGTNGSKISQQVLIEDPDDSLFSAAYIILSNPIDFSGEELTYSGSNTNLLSNPTSDTLVLSGTFNHQTLAGILDSITYINHLDTPTAVTRNIAVVAFDGEDYNDTAYAQLEIIPQNDRPNAQNDLLELMEDFDSVIVDVINNDFDIDSDLDSNITIIYGPVLTGSSIELISAGFIYRLNDNIYGVDSLFYELCDTDGACDTALAIINVAPVVDIPITQTDKITIAEDSTGLLIQPLLNDIDYDNDLDSSSLQVLQSTVNANGGTLTQNTITFSYSPASNFNGVDTIVYEICDLTNNCVQDSIFITVTAVDDKPITQTDYYDFIEDSPQTLLNVLDNDIDYDNDLDTSSLSIINETVTSSGGFVGVGVNGGLNYEPGSDFFGIDTIVYQICDQQPFCSTDSVFVNISGTDDSPITEADDIVTDEEIIELSIDVLGNDYDPDNDLDTSSLRVVYSTVENNDGIIAVTDGMLVYTAGLHFYGTDTLVYEICDQQPVCARDTLIITVNNIEDAPITLKDTVTLKQGSQATVDVLLNDFDPDQNIDPGSLSIIRSDADASVPNISSNNIDLDYSDLPTFIGSNYLIYEICDLLNNCSQDSLLINVIAGADPVTTNDILQIDEDASPALINVANNDTDPDGNLDPESVSIIDGPFLASNSVQVQNDGSLLFSPGLNVFGVDSIIYQICDQTARCSQGSLLIEINEINDQPVAGDDQAATDPGMEIIVNVLANDLDPDLEELSIAILENPNLGVAEITTDERIRFTPNPGVLNGTDSLVYIVCDLRNACDTAKLKISIPNSQLPPNASNDNFNGNEDDDINLDVLANDVDPNQDVLHLSSIITRPLNGQAQISGNIITYSPNDNYFGTDSLRYEVCDGGNLCSSAWAIINIASVADYPVTASDYITLTQGGDSSIDVRINDIDVDNDLNMRSVRIITEPLTAGALANLNNNYLIQVDFTGAPLFTGEDFLTYEICDLAGNCSSDTLFITIEDGTGPITNPDFVSFLEDEIPILIEPLTNDSDINNNLDAQSLKIINTSSLSGAEFSIGTNGTILYTTEEHVFGYDTLVYQICDFTQICSQDSIFIDISNVADAPLPSSDNIDVLQGDIETVNVLSNDIDPDEDLDVSSLRILLSPTSGAAGEISDDFNIILDYSSNISFTGKDTLVYEICDLTSLCSSDTLFINVLSGKAPITQTDSVSMLEDGGELVVDVLENDYDPEDNLNRSSLKIMSGPNDVLNEAEINEDGFIIFKPRRDYHGEELLVYQICDSTQLCSFERVSITVLSVNDLPIAVEDSAQIVEDAVNQEINVLVNDSDVDGDIDASSISITEGPAVPGAIAIINAAHNVAYSPALNYFGFDSLTYEICDDEGGCVTGKLYLEIVAVNDPPLITGLISDSLFLNLPEDSLIHISFNVSDVDNDQVDIINVLNVAQLGVISGLSDADTTIRYTARPNANGIENITLLVCDNGSPILCDTAFVNIQIDNVNDKPFAIDDVSTTDPGEDVIISVLFNDTDLDEDTLSISILDSTKYGSVLITSEQEIIYTPAPGFINGTDTLRYEACDPGGLCDVAFAYIIVPSRPLPPITQNDYVQLREDQTGQFDVLKNDLDPNGDYFTLSEIGVDALHGTTTINNDSISYIPDTDYFGEDSLEYVVCDEPDNIQLPSQCASAWLVINILPVNDKPFIPDVNGEPTRIIEIAVPEDETSIIPLNIIDVDGDTVFVNEFYINPVHGAVSKQTLIDTTIEYTPVQNYFGMDTFALSYCDVFGACDSVVVNVDVINLNDHPQIKRDSLNRDTLYFETSTTISVDICLSGIDQDGDTIDVTAAVFDQIHGSIFGLSDGDTCINYEPSTSFTGIEVFKLKLCDENNTCDSIHIHITISGENQAPETPDSLLLSTLINKPIVGCIPAIDPDSNKVFMGNLISNPANGFLEILDEANACFSYTPDLNFTGSDVFIATVCDDGIPSKCDTTIVYIDVRNDAVNNAPTAVNDTLLALEDSVLIMNVMLNDEDIDNNPISITSIITTTNHGQLLNTGSNLVFLPDENYFGGDSAQYVICDNGIPALCDTAWSFINIQSVNDKPVAQDDEGATIINQSVAIAIMDNDYDIDDANLQAIVLNTNSNGSYSLDNNNILTYTPALDFTGLDTLIYVICDDESACDTAKIVITVSNEVVNLPPIAVNDSLSLNEDETLVFDPHLNDRDPNNHDLTTSRVIQLPEHGRLRILNDRLSYTPVNHYYGLDSAIIQVCDNGEPEMCDTSVIYFNIAPVNDPPTAVPDTVYAIQGVEIQWNILENDFDVDSKHMYTIMHSAPVFGDAFIDTNGTLTYISPEDYSGEMDFVYEVCDSVDSCSQGWIHIIVELVPFKVYQYITPDNDGENDILFIDGIERYPNNVLRIFNKWGDLIYEIDAYSSEDLDKAWYGQNNVNALSGEPISGTYYYVIDLNDDKGLTFSGFIELRLRD